ncbi:hypothetical protein [Streptomyces luteoverticillatus]|nr:hypothetical protein [Streptomyces luteoverticillatus]
MSYYATPEDAALAGASVLDGQDWTTWDDSWDSCHSPPETDQ